MTREPITPHRLRLEQRRTKRPNSEVEGDSFPDGAGIPKGLVPWFDQDSEQLKVPPASDTASPTALKA